jgi:hypothetical protein
MWSSGQSSWLQIQKFGLDSRSYQIFGEVVGLERGPLSLVSKIEVLLGRSSASGLDSLAAEVGTNFADMWLSLGRYNSFTTVRTGYFPGEVLTTFAFGCEVHQQWFGLWFENITRLSENFSATSRFFYIIGIIWPQKCFSTEFH